MGLRQINSEKKDKRKSPQAKPKKEAPVEIFRKGRHRARGRTAARAGLHSGQIRSRDKGAARPVLRTGQTSLFSHARPAVRGRGLQCCQVFKSSYFVGRDR